MTRRGSVVVVVVAAVVAAAAIVAAAVVAVSRESASATSRATATSRAVAPGATTLAGTGAPGYGGDGGPATRARLDAPAGIAEDGSGDLFVADAGNCRVREVPAHTGVSFGKHVRAGVILTVAGGRCGAGDPEPTSVALDASGDLFIAYPSAARVDELAAGGVALTGTRVHTGTLVTIAGDGVSGYGGDGGPASRAELEDASGIAVDPSGDLLVADTGNCRLRLVAASDGSRFGVPVVRGDIYTVAGDGVCGSGGDGGAALDAELWDPGALTVDSVGDVLVADQGNRTVRELAAVNSTSFGVAIAADHLGTVAGEGSYGPYLVDGLPAVGETAELNFPSGLALDTGGDLYVADGPMHAVRFVADGPATLLGKAVQAGDMATAAGALPSGSLDDETSWVQTRLSDPVGLALSPSGRLVYADAGANVVRELPAGG